MTIIQLQLNLWQQLEQAQAQPQATNWQQLCLAFDEAMDRTPVGLRLATAADAFEQMADVLLARATAWAEDWSRRPGNGPVLDEALFNEFVRQSFSLDLSGLVEEPILYVRSSSEKSHEEAESVVEYREKTEVLAELESFVEEDAGGVEQLEYDEDVAVWAEAIRVWMKRHRINEVMLGELLRGSDLPTVKCWLAVLLGAFDLRLSETKGFYDVGRVLIALPNGHSSVSEPLGAIAGAAANG
jgi:hypothetical protein